MSVDKNDYQTSAGITMKLSEYRELKEWAAAMNTTQSQIGRAALKEYYERHAEERRARETLTRAINTAAPGKIAATAQQLFGEKELR